MPRATVVRPRRVRTLVVASLVVVTVLAAACGSDGSGGLPRPSEEFCEIAYEYDQNIARIGPDDPDGHLEYLEEMRDLAPDDIRSDLDRFAQAMRQVREGDDSVVDDPEVEAAGDRFYRRAIDGCRLHDQDPPGGF